MNPPTGPRLGTATRDRLRIAIQKSGRLAEPARSLLAACGLSWRESRDKLFCYGESLPVDLLLVRDDDIPGLIADGVCDLGIVGRNELDEQAGARARKGLRPAYRALRGLGFGQCRLMLAVPEEWEWTGPSQLQGLRIATSYPAVLAGWLDAQGIDAQVVELSGSVEIAPRLGTADLVCDLVSSGAPWPPTSCGRWRTCSTAKRCWRGRPECSTMRAPGSHRCCCAGSTACSSSRTASC